MTAGGNITGPGIAFPVLIALSVLLPPLIHLIVSRGMGLYRDKALRQKGAIVSVIAGAAVLLILFIVLEPARAPGSGWPWKIIYLLGIYFLFGYVYFHIFNMSETARRIRILAHGHREGRMVKEELTQNYTRREMVEIRVARLLALGELRKRDSRYIGGKGLLIPPARAVFAFRRLLRLDR